MMRNDLDTALEFLRGHGQTGSRVTKANYWMLFGMASHRFSLLSDL
jgi:hypothetical protein